MNIFSLNLQLSDKQLASVERLFNRLIDAVLEHVRVTTEGFDKVAEAISKLQTPAPSPEVTRGTLMSRYRVPATQDNVTFELVGSNFKDAEGNEASAANIDLTVQSTNEGAVGASIGPGVVSEDGKTVSATVTLTFGSPSVDMATVEYKATNRNTGAVVAGDSDEFIVGPGEASIGTLDSPVPLPAEAE